MRTLQSKSKINFLCEIETKERSSVNLVNFLKNERFECHEKFLELVKPSLEIGNGIVEISSSDTINLYVHKDGFETVTIQNAQDELIHLGSKNGRLELQKRLGLLKDYLGKCNLKTPLFIGWFQSGENDDALYYSLLVFPRSQDGKLIFHAGLIKPLKKRTHEFLFLSRKAI